MSGRAALALAAAAVASAALVWPAAPSAQRPAAPAISVETTRGAFIIETFPSDAPVTVKHVVALVRDRFYDGLRVHRALPGFVVQFGDPQSRDLNKRMLWGRGAGAGSGKPVGVAEITRKRLHRAGAVGLAHLGGPARADSQIYIALEARPDLDGRYAVFGQVVSGTEVPALLEVGDVVTKMSVQE
jgi:cyclophilin family peptidyl-prolyl cis-trans isomerase